MARWSSGKSTNNSCDVHRHRVATQTEHIDEPEHLEFSVEAAVSAVDAVTRVYPDAVWHVTGDQGRIVAGDLLVSLAVSLTDEDAELCAWLDAADRLGPMAGAGAAVSR